MHFKAIPLAYFIEGYILEELMWKGRPSRAMWWLEKGVCGVNSCDGRETEEVGVGMVLRVFKES